MPAKKSTRKKSTSAARNKKSLKQPWYKKKGVLFVLAFAVIGGGYYIYNTFAIPPVTKPTRTAVSIAAQDGGGCGANNTQVQVPTGDTKSYCRVNPGGMAHPALYKEGSKVVARYSVGPESITNWIQNNSQSYVRICARVRSINANPTHFMIVGLGNAAPGPGDLRVQSGDYLTHKKGTTFQNHCVLRGNLKPKQSTSGIGVITHGPGFPSTITNRALYLDKVTVELVDGPMFGDVIDHGGAYNFEFSDVNFQQLGGHILHFGCNPPSNTNFCTHKNMTRAHLAMIASPRRGWVPSKDYFKDDSDHYAEPMINVLSDYTPKIEPCNPPKNDNFCPGQAVTRAEAAYILANYWIALPNTTKDYFDDDTGKLYQSSINKVAAAGIMTHCGTNKKKFCPEGKIKNGEMARALQKLVAYQKKNKLKSPAFSQPAGVPKIPTIKLP